MSAELVQAGHYLDHTPLTDISAGTPIDLGNGLIGVPPNDLEAGRKGAVAIAGVHKSPNSGIAASVGTAVDYDPDSGDGAIVASGGGGLNAFEVGPLVADVAAGDEYAYYLINGKTM